MWVKLEPDMEQLIGSKLEKEYNKGVYCHPAYLTYRQSTSCKIPGWMSHKLELRLLGEVINIYLKLFIFMFMVNITSVIVPFIRSNKFDPFLFFYIKFYFDNY